MVRSSIACTRCRRSKVKCVNTGVSSTCKACAQSNRDCTYPVAGSVPPPKRNDVSAGTKQEEGESKKRIRKFEDTGRRSGQKTGEDVLDSPILTKQTWDDLYDIFKRHFSTEMPFLHPFSFKSRYRQASYPRNTENLQGGRILLLGVLTLTARFHPELVAHHSPNGDPLGASEYYADALKVAFGPTSSGLISPTLESIQAFLMLGLYEWGQTRGLSAWVYVGIATRLAQSMGLPYEDDNSPSADLYPPQESHRDNTTKEAITEKEVRRRTWWSCFIMDRMLSAGRWRPMMINLGEIRLRLPCSDEQFLFQKPVRTAFLTYDFQPEEEEVINDEGVLGWYIRLVDIFGRFNQWSYAGGRRSENRPPWETTTKFYQLRADLDKFRVSLPSSLAFTAENLSAHIEQKNATAYASLHTLFLLIEIQLHREYLPFIPINCARPEGPLDEPTFPPNKFRVPDKFWERSAETVFRSARDIIDIVRTLRDEHALPESAQLGFAIWQASFVCLYSSHFKHMDTAQQVPQNAGHRNRNKNWTSITGELLDNLAPRLKMISGFQRTFKKSDEFWRDFLKQYYDSDRSQSLSFSGGGLDHYKSRAKDLKEFGGLSDQTERSDVRRSRASTDEATPSANGDAMSGVENDTTPRGGRPGWAPVNKLETHDTNDRAKYEVQQPTYGAPNGYANSPHTMHQPGMITANGNPVSALNSPYSQAPGQQYQPVQSHPANTYSPLAQHPQAAMALPRAQWSDDQMDNFNNRINAVAWSAAGDNFAQQHNLAQNGDFQQTWQETSGGLLPEFMNYQQVIGDHSWFTLAAPPIPHQPRAQTNAPTGQVTYTSG